MDTPRERIRSVLLPYCDGHSIAEIERGVYNWTIDFCKHRSIPCNWENAAFTRIYVEKARSLIFNMRCIPGMATPPDQFAYMLPQELNPTLWESHIKSYNTKLQNTLENSSFVPITDMFRCGKCKQRKCSFYELQVRSADESTTVFITCLNCGNSWRQ